MKTSVHVPLSGNFFLSWAPAPRNICTAVIAPWMQLVSFSAPLGIAGRYMWMSPFWTVLKLTALRSLTQTFEAKIHHLETRPSRKPRDGLEDLEYFVQCEVHLSDVSTLVSSIKRIAEDVRTTKEVKCELYAAFKIMIWDGSFHYGLDILWMNHSKSEY